MLCLVIFLESEKLAGNMNIQDPISDLITQIRNGYSAKKEYITVYCSKKKLAILNVLKKEHFITDYLIIEKKPHTKNLKIILKYYGKKLPIIKKIERISKPSVRIYSKSKSLPKIASGFGIAIISTPFGVMSDKEARKKKYGGEIICQVE